MCAFNDMLANEIAELLNGSAHLTSTDGLYLLAFDREFYTINIIDDIVSIGGKRFTLSDPHLFDHIVNRIGRGLPYSYH